MLKFGWKTKMKTQTKKIFAALSLALALILLIQLANANLLYCLNDGEQLPPNCAGNECRYTCNLRSGQGLCQICTTDSGTPGVNPNTCGDQTCTILGDNNGGSVDTNPPELIINSPQEDATYSSTRILFDLEVNVYSLIEYKTSKDTRWNKICDGCSHYSRHIRLEEGPNEITIRAKKISNSLTETKTLTFNIDSKEPDFRKSWPDNGDSANGQFTVEYTEENLEIINLNYKGETELSWNTVKLQNCPSGEKVQCSKKIDLSSYENSNLNYFFSVCDKAQCDLGDAKTVRVDSTPPTLILNTAFQDFYSVKKILFDLSTNEPVRLFYIDNNDPKQKEKRLCSNCNFLSKLIRFRDGLWNITIFSEDSSLNKDSLGVQFFVDTKKPKISKTEPRKGFASGSFYVEMREKNPKTLTLNYGTFLDLRKENINLENCTPKRNKLKCSANVDLEDFNQQKIVYWFELVDIADNTAQSKQISLSVDTTEPIIEDIQAKQNDKRVEFKLKIDEPNFDETMYIIDQFTDSRAKWKKMCSKLKNSECVKKINFRKGNHIIDFQVFDKAGNSIGTNQKISV